MNICKKCGNGFPNRVTINGKAANLCARKYCLICSPFGMRSMQAKPQTSKTKYCSHCKEDLPIKRFYKRRKHSVFSWCKICLKQEGLARHRAFKLKCVDYKGGACIKCGYKKYMGALGFHHTNPLQKDFTIGQTRNHKWTEKIKLELDKCILLCSNCHKETHVELNMSL